MDLKSLLGIAPQTIEALMNQAAEFYSNGQFEKMRKVLSGVIALAPQDPRPHTLMGSSYLLEGRDREAEQAYATAYTHDPSDPYTLVALGELKLRSLDLQEAVAYFEKLFALKDSATHPAAQRGRELVREYHQRLSGQ